jgi:nitrogen-specific signal transduction histidine kinase
MNDVAAARRIEVRGSETRPNAKIRVSNRRELRNGARHGARLIIADTLSGIQPEIGTRLFDPFVSTKGDTRTGLGLWMSSEIVRRRRNDPGKEQSLAPICRDRIFGLSAIAPPARFP